MSLNSNLALNNQKNAPLSVQVPSAAQSQSSSSPATEHHSQKRAGGSGSFGSAPQSRSSSTPRNNQSLRKQHRGQRRPRLADEDAAAESAAMQSTSSRKGRTSITHLMNFTLPPRPQYHPQHHFGRNVRRNPTWGLGSGYHAADKARYIRANYRFIVHPSGDYRSQAVDPDIPLDWGNVLQILVSAQSQATNCPICLSKPVAPRMAKCGHIFCLPCLIRYMHSTDDVQPVPEKKARWKKCPICDDIMYISDTRPVRWFVGQEDERPREGGDVVLRLMMRTPGSTLALPRDGAESMQSAEEVPWYFVAEVMDYARLMKGSEDYMVQQHEEEIEELRVQEREDELLFGDDVQWMNKAIASVQGAIEKSTEIGNPPSEAKAPVERKPRRPPVEYHNEHEDFAAHYSFQHGRNSGQSSSRGSVITQYERSGSTASKVHAGNRTPGTPQSMMDISSSLPRHPQSSSVAKASTSPMQTRGQSAAASHHSRTASAYYFYEALLHFYLSSLDIRILRAEFGDYSSFPTTILPRVEHVSTGHIIDDDLRKRAKYLAHLPHGCEVGFLECDWTDIVSPQILERFGPEIDRRRKKHLEKATREEKERVRAEKEEDDKRWAAARRRRPSLNHDVRSDVVFQPLPESSALDLNISSSSPPWPSARAQQGSAFASLASPSTSPVTQKTVWGTRVVAPTTPPMQPISAEHEIPESDGWLQDWEAQLLREDEMIAQMETMSVDASSSKQGNASASSGGGGKKKKGKKITLMSTNARRGA